MARTPEGFVWYNGVLPPEVYEVNGTRSETYNTMEFTGHVDYICPWENRYGCARWLLGTVYNNPVYTGATDYYYTDYYPALVSNISVGPVGEEGITVPLWGSNLPPLQKYTLAKISVDYRGRARPGNLTVQETVTPNIGMRTLPSWGFYWRSDGAPVLDAEAPAIMQFQLKIGRTISGVRRIPDWFYRLAGAVNYNPWTDMLTGKSYLPGTLLFNPTSMDRTITMARDDDDYVWNIQFEISWNPIGWNNFQRPHGIDMLMYDAQPVYMYPVTEYPLLLMDPNAPSIDQMVGDPYWVTLQRYDGSTYTISVDVFGNILIVPSPPPFPYPW